MQTELLLKRRDQIEPGLEEAMLRHYGEHERRRPMGLGNADQRPVGLFRLFFHDTEFSS
jgi:hypothetical protein